MPFFTYDGAYATPGTLAAQETVEAAVTWADFDHNKAFIVPAVIDGASLDAGHASNTTHLRPGLLMGSKWEGAGNLKFKEWTPAGTDGTQFIAGVLLTAIETQLDGADQDRWYWILVGGNLKASNLIIPGQAAAGLSGQALEFYVRMQMAQRFLLDDPHHVPGGVSWRQILDKTGDYTVTTDDRNTLFTTLGNAADINFTLPAVAKSQGLRFGFYNAVDFELMITAAAVTELITFNDAAADTVAFTTAGEHIGGYIEVLGLNNAKWAVIHHGANTLTVV